MSGPRSAAPLCDVYLVGLLLLAAGGSVTPAYAAEDDAPGRILSAAAHPLQGNATTVVAEKIPLVELFTATWCPPCAPADRALERLIFEENTQTAIPGGNATQGAGFTLLAYHPFPDIVGEDPFGTPEGHARLTAKHGAFWFPSLYVDGIYEDRPATRSWSVDAGMEGLLYESYRQLIASAREAPSPVVVTVASVRVHDVPAAWEVRVRVEASEEVSMPLFAQAALWEDPVRFAGSNGIDNHRMIVRALAQREVLEEGLATGEVWTHTWRVEAPAGADPERVGVTILLETVWEEETKQPATPLFLLAIAVTIGVAVVAAVDVRSRRRRIPDGAGGP